MIIYKILAFYMNINLFYTVGRTKGEDSKMEKSEQRIRQNLLDVGCCLTDCEAFLQLSEDEQRSMLEGQRREILTELHTLKDKLDCLDYLRYHYGKKNLEDENGKRDAAI